MVSKHEEISWHFLCVTKEITAHSDKNVDSMNLDEDCLESAETFSSQYRYTRILLNKTKFLPIHSENLDCMVKYFIAIKYWETFSSQYRYTQSPRFRILLNKTKFGLHY